MYKVILLITSLIHPKEDVRKYALGYSVINYTFNLAIGFSEVLTQTRWFFVGSITLELVYIALVVYVIKDRLHTAILISLGCSLIVYNYYEWYNFNLTETLTYKHYLTINLITLDIMVAILYLNTSVKGVIRRLLYLPFPTVFLSAMVLSYILYTTL